MSTRKAVSLSNVIRSTLPEHKRSKYSNPLKSIHKVNTPPKNDEGYCCVSPEPMFAFEGALTNLLATRFGTRRVVICGGLLTTTGFLLSAVAEALPVLYITYGVFIGTSAGLSMPVFCDAVIILKS